MPDYFIAVLVLVIAILISSVLVSPKFKKWRKQKLAVRRHKLAEAGKIECEDKHCSDIATRLTPNGFFCEWHWEPMSKRKFLDGGYVIWSYKLSHAVRRS